MLAVGGAAVLAGCGSYDLSAQIRGARLPAGAPIGTDVRLASGVGQTVRISADGGTVAWTASIGGGRARLLARVGDHGPVRVLVRRFQSPAPEGEAEYLNPREFDVGPGLDGTPTVVWATGCSTRTRRCAVRAVPAAGGRIRTLTSIPNGGSPVPTPVSLDGRRLAFEDRVGDGCWAPYVMTLPRGRPIRLDAGKCAYMEQLDLAGNTLAALAVRENENGDTSEARLIRLGDGRSQTVQSESESQAPNALTAIALDGDALYTARASVSRTDIFTRIPLDGGRRTLVHAFASLGGGFARDRGRQFYEASDSIVESSDPFATRRLLPPVLSVERGGDGRSVHAGVVRGRVTRDLVIPDRRLGPQGIAGVKVLVTLVVTHGTTAVPIGSRYETTSDAQGRWTIRVAPASREHQDARVRAVLMNGTVLTG